MVLQGVSTHIKLKAAGELQESGKREVYFEANGVPRVVEVVDKKSTEVLGKAAIREKVRPQYQTHPCAVLGAWYCWFGAKTVINRKLPILRLRVQHFVLLYCSPALWYTVVVH